MSSATQIRATIDDLYRAEGKAELIGGRVVRYRATGRRPSRVAARILTSLDDHAEQIGNDGAYTGGMGFAVDELSSGRESFSPDASFYSGKFPANEMRFIEGPPTFAAEVRSESDYTEAAEAEMAAKRADYFEAGTLVVWDVDPVANLVDVDRPDAADQPVTFGPGQIADAEPAVPGWRLAVDAIFA
jgi:Uma2 family endonuclease